MIPWMTHAYPVDHDHMIFHFPPMNLTQDEVMRVARTHAYYTSYGVLLARRDATEYTVVTPRPRPRRGHIKSVTDFGHKEL